MSVWQGFQKLSRVVEHSLRSNTSPKSGITSPLPAAPEGCDEGREAAAQQSELLLAVSGLLKEKRPTVKEVVAQPCLEHHTVVELADRLQKSGLAVRRSGGVDKP